MNLLTVVKFDYGIMLVELKHLLRDYVIMFYLVAKREKQWDIQYCKNE